MYEKELKVLDITHKEIESKIYNYNGEDNNKEIKWLFEKRQALSTMIDLINRINSEGMPKRRRIHKHINKYVKEIDGAFNQCHDSFLAWHLKYDKEMREQNYWIPKGEENRKEEIILHNLLCRDANVMDCELADEIAKVLVKAGYKRLLGKEVGVEEILKVIRDIGAPTGLPLSLSELLVTALKSKFTILRKEGG